MIATLPFCSPLVYSTRGESEIAARSRRLRDRVKGADTELFAQIAGHVRELVASGHFQVFFGADVTLVPVPGHAPLAPGARSTAERIAQALLAVGLAREVLPILVRTTPVQKSAYARPADRPGVTEHYTSLVIEPQLLVPTRILLVDDFITRGATVLAAASRLQERYPRADLRAFALVRSITDADIASQRAPVEGLIELLADGQTRRRP